MNQTPTPAFRLLRASLLLFLLAVGLLTTANAQTIRRCNNNPGVTGPNIYSSIQSAHDASANGDIIYMEASGTNYGPLSCAKRLTIYGRGYFLGTNPNGNDTQTEAYMGSVTFGNGSSNTLMSGCGVYANSATITFGTGVSGITVERSYVSDGIIFNSTCTGATSHFANSCTIKQCFINYGGIGGTCNTWENNANRITILNCILNVNFGGFNNTIYFLNNSSVSNCNVALIRRVANMTVTNCLIYDFVDQYIATSFNYCLDRGNTVPAGTGNQNGIDFNNVYVSNVANPNVPDTRYQLSVGSPARGAGINGTDCGAFGGANPYVLSGQPPIPIITNLVSNPSGNNNAPLNVKISVRSNN